MAVQQIHTYCAMCVSQCGIVASVEDGILKNVNIDPDHPNGCICVKGTAAPEIVYSPDRLKYPMVRTRPKGERDPGWVRVSWDEAMGRDALIHKSLTSIFRRHKGLFLLAFSKYRLAKR